jgi:hypothetical protein
MERRGHLALAAYLSSAPIIIPAAVGTGALGLSEGGGAGAAGWNLPPECRFLTARKALGGVKTRRWASTKGIALPYPPTLILASSHDKNSPSKALNMIHTAVQLAKARA